MLTEAHKEKIKYLNQYRYLNTEIDRKIKSLESWRSKIYNVTGTISNMPRNPNRVNTIEEGVSAIEEIESSINNDIDSLLKLRKEIEGKIDGMNNPQLRELLKCRYIDFQSWEEIAYKSDITWRHVYRLHENALDKINLE